MFIARCLGRISIRRIMTKSITSFSLHCTKTLFEEETPCLSPEGQEIIKELGDWCMTPDGVYIRIARITKPPHWLPHFVPESLLLQEIAHKTFINGVVASLQKHKKGLWPQFPLMTSVCKIENFR
jgi:hypothetical protein